MGNVSFLKYASDLPRYSVGNIPHFVFLDILAFDIYKEYNSDKYYGSRVLRSQKDPIKVK